MRQVVPDGARTAPTSAPTAAGRGGRTHRRFLLGGVALLALAGVTAGAVGPGAAGAARAPAETPVLAPGALPGGAGAGVLPVVGGGPLPGLPGVAPPGLPAPLVPDRFSAAGDDRADGDGPAAEAAPGPQAPPLIGWPFSPSGALALGAPQARTVSGLVSAYADRLERAEQLRTRAVGSWKLPKAPLRAPAPPRKKPELATERGHITGKGLPPVITQVPTEDKVVFLTIDDGAEKDPELLRMMRELDIPYSSFLTDYVSRDDYGYFRTMRKEGARIQNHSVTHKEMPRLSLAEQRKEICDQQDILEKEIGERPTMFRPPYGAYNRDTLKAAAECGVDVVPLWTAEAFADRMEWGRGDGKLHPGDIILTHFRGKGQWGGSMTDMVRLVVRTATEQGYAIGRLEDYV
ncbi:polysaccharide deacetylase family protein [Streptomyces lonarensis]|uniref:Polysaccharide deacetylase family protein n=2 Tax=Streptomyces lonarensis TaxID=700599 RepID=A0A7X6D386_9ACTN|nr:polysaccharide deacetylase family protein [Streptomyces lonarensis]